jgi:hypothetical protein
MLLHSRRKRERERETFRERWRERTLTISKYKAILGNCNGALYINIKYFHIFTKELGSIFIPRHCHMLYTLRTKEKKHFENISQESIRNKGMGKLKLQYPEEK